MISAATLASQFGMVPRIPPWRIGVVNMAKTKTKVPSAEDLLAKAGKKASKKKTSAPKKEKPTLKLDKKLEADFLEFCRVHHIEDIIGGVDKTQKKDINGRIFDVWVENLWETGTVVNPQVVAFKKSGQVDASATFIVQGGSRVKVVLPPQEKVDDEEEEEPQDVVFATLTAGEDGLTKENALSLIKSEMDFTPRMDLSRSLTELMQGHYGEKNQFFSATDLEKSGATKVLMFLTGEADKNGNVTVPALSEAEYEEIIIQKPKITVKNEFLSRAKKYCKTLQQLKKLLAVLQPVFYVKYTKFGVSDTEEVKTARIRETVETYLFV